MQEETEPQDNTFHLEQQQQQKHQQQQQQQQQEKVDMYNYNNKCSCWYIIRLAIVYIVEF